MQQPHPEILIGGGGEQLTLRVVARHADASNFGGKPHEWQHKAEVLQQHCKDVGRDYDEIDKTVLARVALSSDGSGSGPGGKPYATVDETVERFGKLSEAGIDTVIMGLADNTEDATYGLVAELVRQVEPLSAR